MEGYLVRNIITKKEIDVGDIVIEWKNVSLILNIFPCWKMKLSPENYDRLNPLIITEDVEIIGITDNTDTNIIEFKVVDREGIQLTLNPYNINNIYLIDVLRGIINPPVDGYSFCRLLRSDNNVKRLLKDIVGSLCLSLRTL